MPDPTPSRKLTAAEAEQVIARAASLDADGEGGSLSADDVRASALAAGIAPHAVERALREQRSPAAAPSGESRRYMGLPAVSRANITLSSPYKTPEEIAGRLRIALGADARIKKELGAVRAVVDESEAIFVTVVPGSPMSVSIVADQSSGVAITALAFGVGGVLVGLMSTLFLGVNGQTSAVLLAIAGGAAAGLGYWYVHWWRYLSRESTRVKEIAASVAAALSEP